MSGQLIIIWLACGVGTIVLIHAIKRAHGEQCSPVRISTLIVWMLSLLFGAYGLMVVIVIFFSVRLYDNRDLIIFDWCKKKSSE
jgi:hypothetical protein